MKKGPNNDFEGLDDLSSLSELGDSIEFMPMDLEDSAENLLVQETSLEEPLPNKLDSEQFEELCTEISQGKYDRYRRWITGSYKASFIELPDELGCPVEHIARALQGTDVRKLNMVANSMGPEKALILAKGLLETTICDLKIQDNDIGAAGAVELLHILKNQLHTLNVGINQLGAQGAIKCVQALDTGTIRCLKLWDCNIDDNSLEVIGKLLPHTTLKAISLSSNPITQKGLIAFIKALAGSKITRVDFSGMELDVDGVLTIAEDLQKTNIREISLHSSAMGSEAAVQFIRALKGSSVRVKLQNCNIDAQAAATIMLELQSSSSLMEVDLRTNDFTEIDVIKLLPTQSPFAQQVKLRNKEEHYPDMNALAETVSSSTVLNLCGYDDEDQEDLDEVLKTNQKRFILPAYYMVAATTLPKEEVRKHCFLTEDDIAKENGQLRNGGGIVMSLHKDLCRYVMGYLPLMTRNYHGDQVPRLLNTFKEKHPNGVQVENEEQGVTQAGATKRKKLNNKKVQLLM